jgi:hypothetical protein
VADVNSSSQDLSRGMLLSVGIHFSILVIAFLGLPDWFSRKIEPQPMVITLENLPVTDKTNVRPSVLPVVRQKQPPTPVKAPPKPPTSKPKPPPPPPQPKAEPEKPKEKVEPDPIPKKEAIKKPTPPKEQPKPKPTPPAKKPAKETPKPDSKADEAMEDEALKDLIDKAVTKNDDKAKPVKNPTPAANQTKSDAPFDASLPLSISEKDAITSQFVACWRIPAGAASDYSLKVSIDVWLRPDGSVIKAHLTGDQRGKYNADGVFRAAADSALRAVHMCSPLKNLPTSKYNSWKEMRLNFDPSMQLY